MRRLQSNFKYLAGFSALAGAAGSVFLAGCQSPAEHRARADRVAAEIIGEKQDEALGRTEPFTIERPSETFRQRLMLEQNLPAVGPASHGMGELQEPEHWPEVGEPPYRPEAFLPESFGSERPVQINLIEALQLSAANSRAYQSEKESLFNTALGLDLERYRFDTTFTGFLEGIFSTDQQSYQTGVEGTAEVGFERQLKSGAALGGRLVVDLVRLLSGEGATSLGLAVDGSISIPLLRGSGRHIVTEPLTQAERDVLYAIYQFERFKIDYAVRVADEYFSVLQQLDQIANTEASYRRLVLLVERTEALHDRSRVTGIEVDQARQDLLRSRERWIGAQENYSRALDRFKLTLGLPTDARIELSDAEFERLMNEAEVMLGEQTVEVGLDLDDEEEPTDGTAEIPEPDPSERGRYEFGEDSAITLAMENRLDLRIAEGEVFDAQRQVVVAADALRPGLNLTGGGSFGSRRSLGSATSPDARLDPSDGFYSLGAAMDMPWSRRSEQIGFRQSLIRVDSALRNFQELEDQVKLDVRDSLSTLLQQREGYRIQTQALDIAERRVRQAQAFQEVDRAETRDVLEANEALLQAQNSVVDSLVSYRIAELNMQRNLGLLEVNNQGLWIEYSPNRRETEEEE
ncbi:MAG: TolC family protein [Opitutales bacterium]